MKGALLTVPEARALLRADEMLHIEFETQLGVEERAAWKSLMESARERFAAWGPSTETVAKSTMSVLACREGSSWVVQALEQDIASQGASMLGALADLGRMFDARDVIIVAETNVAPVPRAPTEYEQAFDAGHYVGILPLGAVRVARVYIGISPFAQTCVTEISP